MAPYLPMDKDMESLDSFSNGLLGFPLEATIEMLGRPYRRCGRVRRST